MANLTSSEMGQIVKIALIMLGMAFLIGVLGAVVFVIVNPSGMVPTIIITVISSGLAALSTIVGVISGAHVVATQQSQQLRSLNYDRANTRITQSTDTFYV